VSLEASDSPKPKQSDQVVIAHISDLHFETTTDHENRVWKALCEDLKGFGKEIDLLAVTGDLIDSSVPDNLGRNGVETAFRNVKNFLLNAVCTAAVVDPRVAMFVLPGNHDFRLTGLIWKQSQFDLFYREFGLYFGHRLFSQLRVAVFSFDSNSPDRPLNFATGLVKSTDLIDHNDQVREISRAYPELWRTSTRVVLVHHHPMPIAPTQHREELAAGEEFMLLKNAGLFMEQMVKTKMDLVLHGHRHYPAYSRVSFPTSEGGVHSMGVVAAGSVGKHGDHDYSYNLVRISSSGELSLERRILTEAVYKRETFFLVSNYEDAREKRCEPDNTDTRQICADKYIRVDTIRAGSGDAVIDETFFSARSLGEPIPTMAREITSHSGVFGDWTYESPQGQTIEWKWNGPPTGGKRKGLTTLEPPLGKQPLTFSRHGTTFNAIHFNQRDRMDATNREDKEEWIHMSTRHIFGRAILQVSFPEQSFPENFRLEVRRPDEKTRDYQEEEYLNQQLTRFPTTNSVILTLPKPIPNYSYRIVWSLPADDAEELKLTAPEKGLAASITQKLLSSRAPGSSEEPKVREALLNLRKTILSVPSFRSPVEEQDDQLEIELLAYDAEKGGLVFAVTLSGQNEKLMSCVIRPGRLVVGQAFRRKEEVLLINLPNLQSETAAIYEAVPGLEHLPEHTVIFAVPLLYPIRNGSKVGALSLGSRSLTSGLLCLHEDRAALLALKEQIAIWYATDLAVALGLKKLSL